MPSFFLLALTAIFLIGGTLDASTTSQQLLTMNDSHQKNAAYVESCDFPLFFWKEGNFTNFGDYLSLKIVERIVGSSVRFYNKKNLRQDRKLLALGSIFYFANENDVVWGAGINGKRPDKKDYSFTNLEIKAVRGPLTKIFLKENFGIECPEIYGDPALLVPYLFPEFKRNENPSRDYIVIPHYLDVKHFKRSDDDHVVYPTDPWNTVIEMVLDSKFVISGSLHGIIVAEAFGIPARALRISDAEPIFKYQDYYLGTGRAEFQFATSIEMALMMGGEPSFKCDLKKLYESFPFYLYPDCQVQQLDFQ